MRLTRNQLRQIINETIFAGGPTVDSPDKSVGVTVDMAKQNSPKFNKEWERDKKISKADPKLAALMKGSEEDQNMARVIADTAFGIPEKVKLNPEEEYAQGLFDEFYPEDIFDEPHDTEDGRLQRSYAPEIKQIRNAMMKRIEAEWNKGNRDYDDLFSAAYTTPGYDNLRKLLRNLPPSEQGGATGLHGDRFPDDQLMLMPGQLIDMYMAHDNPHY